MRKRQAGAIPVDSLLEAVDVVKAISYLNPTTGDGVGIIGGSGGQSVSMSDDFVRAGLKVPTFSQPTLEAMSSFFQLIGASYFNPVDVGGINRSNMQSIIELMAMDSNVDAVAILVGSGTRRRDLDEVKSRLELYRDARDKVGKPFLSIFWAPIPYRDADLLGELEQTLQEVGIPSFVNPERAANVLELLKMNGGNSSGTGIGCVSWDGSVHPDQFWRHHSFGNVRERLFSDIWTDTSEELLGKLRERKKYLKGRCAACKWLDICNGNFRVRAEAVSGDIWAEEPDCYLTDEEIGL